MTTNAVSESLELIGFHHQQSFLQRYADGFERLDWTTAFDLDVDGSTDLINPSAGLPTPIDLTIDFDAGLVYRLSGSLTGTGTDGVSQCCGNYFVGRCRLCDF